MRTIALALLLTGACRSPSVRVIDATPPATPTAEVGPLRAAKVSFTFGIYFAPEPAAPVEVALAGRCADPARALRDAATLRAREDGLGEHGPHEAAWAEEMGVGLSPEQLSGVQRSKRRFLLEIEAPGEQAGDAVRAAAGLAHCVAEETRGLVFDALTEHHFAPAAWRERRVDGWVGKDPDVERQVMVFIDGSGELHSARTAGLERFGLPELAVEEFVASDRNRVGGLLNLVAQALLERGALDGPDELRLDLATLRHRALVDSSDIHPSAKRSAVIRFRPAPGTDASDRRLVIRFDLPGGGGARQQQAALFDDLFGGGDDDVQMIEHDAAFKAAIARARARLPLKKAELRAGLADGTRLLVKAPFDGRDGQREWMWVEIVSWKGKEIRGVLQNEPELVAGLKVGADVVIQESAVIDWMLMRGDEVVEGNETAKTKR